MAHVVRKDEQEDVLQELYSGVAGGHYVGEITVEWFMVANGVAGRTPVREGVRRVPKNEATSQVGADVASARSTARTFPEVGPQLCQPI
jgi:hypothetical protein